MVPWCVKADILLPGGRSVRGKAWLGNLGSSASAAMCSLWDLGKLLFPFLWSYCESR